METIRTAIILFLILGLLVGVAYPLVVTGIAHLVFPKQAGGSLVNDQNGLVIGSELIGQPFSNPSYFWPRPSATLKFPYNPLASGGSNLGPTNNELKAKIIERQTLLIASGAGKELPSDLVMASASGLDPDISVDGALAQIPRIAKETGIDEGKIKELVLTNIKYPTIYILGSERINVFWLNIGLNQLRRNENGS